MFACRVASAVLSAAKKKKKTLAWKNPVENFELIDDTQGDTMTTINELEQRIKVAEAGICEMKEDLETLKKQKTEQTQTVDLFGRWATHPEYGRGIILSNRPNVDGEVSFAWPDETEADGADMLWVEPTDLTIDPATLSTVEDFEDAPTGTIIANEDDAIIKNKDGYAPWCGWYSNEDIFDAFAPAQVIRWGNGE